MEIEQKEFKHGIEDTDKTGEEDLEASLTKPPPSPILEKKYEELKRQCEKIEERSNKSGAKAIQIAAYYVLFMATILIVISIPSTKLSGHRWIPFLLSLPISIIFGLTFTAVIKKWERSCYYFDLNWLELEHMFYKMSSTSLNKKKHMILKPDKVVAVKRYAFMYLAVTSMFAFTLVIFYACFNLL